LDSRDPPRPPCSQMLLCCRVSSELIGRAGMWCQNIMATNYLSFYSPQALLAVGAFAAAAVAARSISAAGFHIPCPLTHPASPGGWPLPSQTEFDQYFAPRFTVTSTASIRHCLFPWLDALKEQVAAVSGARSWRACVCKGLGGRGGGGHATTAHVQTCRPFVDGGAVCLALHILSPLRRWVPTSEFLTRA
jgi:hypothetical protein